MTTMSTTIPRTFPSLIISPKQDDSQHPIQIQLPPKSKLPSLNHSSTKINSNETVAGNKKTACLLQQRKPHLQPQRTDSSSTGNSLDDNGKKYKTRSSSSARCSISDVLRLMDVLRFSVPTDMYTVLIGECTASRDANAALELHAHIARRCIKPPITLLNRVLLMFFSCGMFENALQLFDSMTHRDFNSWGIFIVGYVDNDCYDEAITWFVRMVGKADKLDFPVWFIACVLKACACNMNYDLGKQVHGWIFKLGMYQDLLLATSLITFYGKCNFLEDANAAFDGLSRHNAKTWTAKIISLSRGEEFSKVYSDFKEMGSKGIKKNQYVFSSVLKACGKILDGGCSGRQIHADAIKLGLDCDPYVHCALINMYARNGLFSDAEQAFQMACHKTSIASWNAMLTGYIQQGSYLEAVKFLYRMKAAGMEPEESLVNEVRIACGGS